MSPSKTTTIDFSTFHNIVDGKQRGAKESHHGINPTTGEDLWAVPIATESDVNDAVSSAREAFKTWRNVPLEERRQALYKWSECLVSYKDELTEILCKEVGRPKQFSAMEVDIIKGTIDTLAALELPVERIEDDTKILTTRYLPVGVCCGISPWVSGWTTA